MFEKLPDTATGFIPLPQKKSPILVDAASAWRLSEESRHLKSSQNSLRPSAETPLRRNLFPHQRQRGFRHLRRGQAGNGNGSETGQSRTLILEHLTAICHVAKSRFWRCAAQNGRGAFGKFHLRDFQRRHAQAVHFFHVQFVIAERLDLTRRAQIEDKVGCIRVTNFPRDREGNW